MLDFEVGGKEFSFLEKVENFVLENRASDIHICPSETLRIRIDGKLKKVKDFKFSSEDTKKIFNLLLDSKEEKNFFLSQMEKFRNCGFSVSLGKVRFRVNVSKKGNGYYIVMREIKTSPPPLRSLGFSSRVENGLMRMIKRASEEKVSGIFFVVGQTGSGKSTTLASIIKEIAQRGEVNIITLEDPIEYIHSSEKALIVQKEYGVDFLEFSQGLHSALREDPNIILVGEIRDGKTLELALKGAETGHLVLTTLHTNDVVSTFSRIYNLVSDEKKSLVRDVLSQNLVGIIAQKLVYSENLKRRVLVYEAFFSNQATSALIKEGKENQIYSVMETQGNYSQSFETTLAQLVKSGILTKDKAFLLSRRKEELELRLERNFDNINSTPNQMIQEGDENEILI